MSGGGSSSPSSNTVTQVQEIPQYEQDFSQQNQNLASSLAANPYPQYQGQLIAGQTGLQTTGQQMAVNEAAGVNGQAPDWQSSLWNAANQTAGAANQGINPNSALGLYQDAYVPSANTAFGMLNSGVANQAANMNYIPDQYYQPSGQAAQSAVAPTMNAAALSNVPNEVGQQNPYAAYGLVSPTINAASLANVPNEVTQQNANAAYGMVQPTMNAASLASVPYEVQQQNAGSAYSALNGQIDPSIALSAMGANPGTSAANTASAAGVQQWNAQTAAQYMSPYEQAALQPQITALNTQLGLEQQQLNASSTQAGAFGDARQGVAQAQNNYNANQTLAGIEATGMNSAYTTGQQAFQNDQTNLLSAYNTGLQGDLTYGAQALQGAQTAITGAQAQQGLNLSAVGQAQNISNAQTQNLLSAQQAALAGSQAQSGLNLSAFGQAQNVSNQQTSQQLAAQQAALSGSQAQSGLNLSAYGQAQTVSNQQTQNMLAAQQAALAGSQAQQNLNLQGVLGAQTIGTQQIGNQLNASQASLAGAQNQENIGLSAFTASNNAGLGQISTLGNLFNTAMSGDTTQQQLLASLGAQNMNLAGQQLGLGTQAANTVYDAGTTVQNQQQEDLNAAYQQYENATQWPYQMLGIDESAISNSPYTIANYTSLPGANGIAGGAGAFASVAGLLGSLSGSSSGNSSPFGTSSSKSS